MIPEAEDSVARSTVDASSPFKSAPATAASGPWLFQSHRHHHRQQQQQQQQQPPNNAWARYRHFVEAMHSQGQAFNRKIVLEAMFRGSDLVYSSGQSSPCTS